MVILNQSLKSKSYSSPESSGIRRGLLFLSFRHRIAVSWSRAFPAVAFCVLVFFDNPCFYTRANIHLFSYAVLDHRIIGFCAGSLFRPWRHLYLQQWWDHGTQRFHHRNIARNMVFCNMRWILKNRHDEGIKHYAFMSISGNPESWMDITTIVF